MLLVIGLSAASIFAGYIAVVLMYLLITFGITAIAPKFVMDKGYFTSGYLFVHPFIWAACGMLGGYVAAAVGSPFPYLSALALAGLVTAIIASNSGELNSRQALRAKSILAGMAILGVAGGSCIVLLR